MRYPPSGTKILILTLLSILLSYPHSISQQGVSDQAEHRSKGQPERYALVITIDGLRPDAIAKSNSPNLKSLIRNGSYSSEAKTVIPSLTLPAHTSLVTGLSPKRHDTLVNHWIPLMGYLGLAKYLGYETMLSIAKKSGFKTAMFVGKDKLKYLATQGGVDHFESTNKAPGSVETIASSFSQYLNPVKPELTFIHFPEPDMTGHRLGWMSEDYIKAVERVDRAMGVILQSLHNAKIYDKTFIIITADHGGKGRNHKVPDPEVITIPWIAYGSGIKKGHGITEAVSIYDTAPTVLFGLGIKPPPDWDGKPIKEIFTGHNLEVEE